MKNLTFILVLLIAVTACKKSSDTVTDTALTTIQSKTWVDIGVNAGTVIFYGQYIPYLDVKLDAAGNYRIIRSLSGLSYTQLDTLSGTYTYDAAAKAIKFSGQKLKTIPRSRTNTTEQIYFADWKLKSVSADTLKIDLDYGTFPTEPGGQELYKILVKK